MRKSGDTTLRALALLQLIPAYPQMKSTANIRRELRDKNTEFDVDIRSIQRDLERLSVLFPLSCEQQGRAKHWFWVDKHALTQIPAMNKSTAFAFKLAAEHLKPLLPPSTLLLFLPYFKHATEILQHTKLGRWPTKVRIINRGPELIAPVITRRYRRPSMKRCWKTNNLKWITAAKARPNQNAAHSIPSVSCRGAGSSIWSQPHGITKTPGTMRCIA